MIYESEGGYTEKLELWNSARRYLVASEKKAIYLENLIRDTTNKANLYGALVSSETLEENLRHLAILA